MSPADTYAIVREIVAYGVLEGHYSLQDDGATLGTYRTRRAARNALADVARAEAEARRLVPDPWHRLYINRQGDYHGDAVRLIPAAQLANPSGYRSWAAQLSVKRIPA